MCNAPFPPCLLCASARIFTRHKLNTELCHITQYINVCVRGCVCAFVKDSCILRIFFTGREERYVWPSIYYISVKGVIISATSCNQECSLVLRKEYLKWDTERSHTWSHTLDFPLSLAKNSLGTRPPGHLAAVCSKRDGSIGNQSNVLLWHMGTRTSGENVVSRKRVTMWWSKFAHSELMSCQLRRLRVLILSFCCNL